MTVLTRRLAPALVLSLTLVLGACSAAPTPTTNSLTAKQLMSLLEAHLWEVSAADLKQEGHWQLKVQHFGSGALVDEKTYPLDWKAGEVTTAGFLLRETREGGKPRVLATAYRFGARDGSTTIDTAGVEVDTSFVHSNDTPRWDRSAPPSQTLVTFGLFRLASETNGTQRYESIEWNDETRNSAEFQRIPSVVVVTLERL